MKPSLLSSFIKDDVALQCSSYIVLMSLMLTIPILMFSNILFGSIFFPLALAALNFLFLPIHASPKLLGIFSSIKISSIAPHPLSDKLIPPRSLPYQASPPTLLLHYNNAPIPILMLIMIAISDMMP